MWLSYLSISSIDNCFRENKNRYLFSWLANLVELNVFLEVSINFLIKGHTGTYSYYSEHKHVETLDMGVLAPHVSTHANQSTVQYQEDE